MKNSKKIFGSLAGALAISLAAGFSFTACSDSGESSVSADNRNEQSETANGTTTIKAYLPGNDGKSLKKSSFNGDFKRVATVYTDDGNEIKVSWREPIEGDPNSLEKFDVVHLGYIDDIDEWTMPSGEPYVDLDDKLASGPETFTMTDLGQDGVGTFSGNLPTGCSNDDYALCYAFYPAGGTPNFYPTEQAYADQTENLSMNALYKYDYMYSAIQMNGTTPSVYFKHSVALLDITIKPIGTKENIESISVEYEADIGGWGSLTKKTYFVKYDAIQEFIDTARVIIAVYPSEIPKDGVIKVYFKTAGQDAPTISNIYAKTIQKDGGVSIEAGKYYAMTFENPKCGETPYSSYSQKCNNGVIETLSACGEALYDATTHWCNKSKVEALLIDSRDNKKYKTVEIGNQTWMAENLNYATSTSKCYGDDPDNCAKYGRLYTWADAMALDLTYNTQSAAGVVQTQHQGICPNGWHLPTQAEFDVLYAIAGGRTSNSSTSGALYSLKSTTEWPNGYRGSDKYGLSVLPAGLYKNGNFEVQGSKSYLCGNTELGDNMEDAFKKINAQEFHSKNGEYNVLLTSIEKVEGTSLRCIKNTDTSN